VWPQREGNVKLKRVLAQTGLVWYIRWKGTQNRFTCKLDNIGYILRNGLARNIASIFTLVFESRLVKKVVRMQPWFPSNRFWEMCGMNFRYFDRTDLPGKPDVKAYFFFGKTGLNPLNPELNPICYLLALLGAHHFLHVSRIRVKSLTFRRLMSNIYGAPILDVSRSHTTTQHSR